MLLYNIGIWFFSAGLWIARFFNRKARFMYDGREKIFDRLSQDISGADKIIWIHCASLGEFEQGRPIIESIKKEHPEYKILITFFSPSGYEVRKDYEGADLIYYLPLDTPRNVRRFIKVTHPEIAVFIKYEFWLNYLKALRSAKVRTFLVSAIFHKDSVFFRPHGKHFRNALRTFEKIFVQDFNSANLLSGIGICDVIVSGDTRFDRVKTISETAKNIDVIEKFVNNSKAFIAGSTWPQDEEMVLRLASDYPEIKFIIAPHETDDGRIQKLIETGGSVLRYTEMIKGVEGVDSNILIVDVIGILSSLYRYGHYGYIGGGFGAGIHNTLEAAAFGLPLAFGPNYSKFKEAVELTELGAAKPVNDYKELKEWIDFLEENPQKYAEAKAKALSYVSFNTGATKKFMDIVFNK